MYNELNEEQQLVQLMARDFVKKSIEPYAMDWDKNREFPHDVIKKMGELGFMGMMIPEDYGGSATGAVTYSLAMQEISFGDGGVAVTMSVCNLCCETILLCGNEDQRIKYRM